MWSAWNYMIVIQLTLWYYIVVISYTWNYYAIYLSSTWNYNAKQLSAIASFLFYFILFYSILFYSILGCVHPPQEIALRQSPPTFSVLYCPSIPSPVVPQCHLFNDGLVFQLILRSFFFSVLLMVHVLSFIRTMCPAHFQFALVSYSAKSVALVLCLMMMFRILSFSLTFSMFLAIARWLVSSFFTNAFVRDHVWHPCVIAGKARWLKTFLFRLTKRILSRNNSLHFPKSFNAVLFLPGIMVPQIYHLPGIMMQHIYHLPGIMMARSCNLRRMCKCPDSKHVNTFKSMQQIEGACTVIILIYLPIMSPEGTNGRIWSAI